MTDTSRRTFIRGLGAATATAALAGEAAARVSTRALDRQFDVDGGLQEALVVFDGAADADRLADLDLAKGYRVFEHLDVAWTFLDPGQLQTVAGWDSVRRVKRSEEIEWYNDETSRESMAVESVREELGYTGEDAHAVVIDSGIDAGHPALQGRVEANYQFVDGPLGSRDPLWVDVAPGDTDDLGHGTHCAGIVGGDGTGSTQADSEEGYVGMAPDVTLTGYATSEWQYLPYVVSAWNHMLGRAKTDPDFDPDVVSNSYGVARDVAYNPNDPVNVATWKAFEAGILPVFALGNDGPGTGTSSRFAKAPHVLGVAAAHKSFSPDDGDDTNERPITDFSSRGRDLPRDATEYDREQTLVNQRTFHALQGADGESYAVADGEFTGRFGPAVNGGPVLLGSVDEQPTESTYHQFAGRHAIPGNVDRVSLTLSMQPGGQWVRVNVYEEDDDGETRRVAAMGEEVFHQHRTLTFDVDPDLSYLVEVKPEDSVTGTYALGYEMRAIADGDLRDARPVTLFRPGISTHGAAVMSTVDRYDVLGNLGPTYGGSGTEPFYARLSGTSMACPGAAGVAALVYEAYRDAHPEGSSPSPIDVVRVIESTARDLNPNYTAYNTGAGFVDARGAVEAAAAMASPDDSVDLETGHDALVDPPEPPAPETTLSVSGSRRDDGSAFTGGQTNQVSLTVTDVSNASTVEVSDEIPADWTVVAGAQPVETEDGRTRVLVGTVDAGAVAGEGDSVTLDYFVEAPDDVSQSGPYAFGPAVAVAASTDEDLDGDGEVAFTGQDGDNVVFGQPQP